MTVLNDLTTLSQEQLIAIIQQQASAASRPQRLSLKLSEKGALSVCGLGRFPVTLYASQWERLLQEIPAIEAFLKANASKLSRKA